MEFNANHPSLYIAAGAVIVFVLAQSCFFLIKAWKQAISIGISSELLKKVVRSTALFTIAPAIAILLGMLTLSKFLGLPLPWLRLSVLGALTYELPAASAAAKVMDVPITQTVTSATEYSAIAWVMTLGILSGIFVILFFEKKMESGLAALKRRDEKWGEIFMDSLFIGMIAAFLGMIFSDIGSGLKGFIPVFVLIFSALIMAVCGLLIKKMGLKALENYAMPISMLSGMLFAIPLTAIIK